jgi:hypothetical protein
MEAKYQVLETGAESAASRSSLPPAPDIAAMEEIVLRAHRACIAKEAME